MSGLEAGIEAQQRATAADATRTFDAQVRRQEAEEVGTSHSARHVIHWFINSHLLSPVTLYDVDGGGGGNK